MSKATMKLKGDGKSIPSSLLVTMVRISKYEAENILLLEGFFSLNTM